MQLNRRLVGDPALSQLAAPDVYFGAPYGAAEQEVAPYKTWQLLETYDGAWQLPIMYSDQNGIADCSSPYGYAGVYADPALTEADRATAWRAALSELRGQGIVSIFVRSSPLVEQAAPPAGARWVVRDHPTRAVDLTSDVWSGMAGRSRTSIRKAAKMGLTAVIRPATSVDLEGGSAFRRLYEGAMDRRDAASRYYFPDAYYRRLLDGLGDNLLIGTVAHAGDQVAAALFMRHGPFVHYHLSGGSPEAGSIGATNLLLWEAAQAGQRAGARVLHLGGGVRPNDSLYAFKRSFGGSDLHFSAYGLVVNEREYDAAVVARAAELEVQVSEINSASMFPAYRMDITR